MEESIGERIKSLRKELKLTQSELAGDEITKSMLSQIENNQATPSMKSLQYIAARLGKSISFFLDGKDENSSRTTEILPVEEIHRQLNNIDSLIKNLDLSTSRLKLEEILSAYEYDKGSKLYADILYKYGECLIDLLEFDNGEEKIKDSVKIYTDLHLYSYAARANLESIGRYLAAYRYDECIKILDECWSMYKHAVNRDPILEIEMLYYRALIKLANSTAEEVLDLIQKALDISKEIGAYYNSDELYRLKATVYFIMEKYDDFNYCIKKAFQFAQFTDNKRSIAKIQISFAAYENVINHPENALEYLRKCDDYSGSKSFIYYITLAHTYYLLGNYNDALNTITKVEYKPRSHHKIDYFTMWTGKVYEGLILHKLNRIEEAISSINMGITELNFFSESKYLAFAYESLSNIYADINDYKNAYYSIHKAYEIRLSLVNSGKFAY